MSHDLYASWATAELSRIFHNNPLNLFTEGVGNNFEIYANREAGRRWPIPDGRITATRNNQRFELAIEFKRENEGLHGLLTAIGQAEAYVHKGYSSSIVVIPHTYEGFNEPGTYISNVLDTIGCNAQIGVFTYIEPDMVRPSPFENRLFQIRNIDLTRIDPIDTGNYLHAQRAETQWAHLREGSSTAYAFYKYLQTAKKLNLRELNDVTLDGYPTEIIETVNRLGYNPVDYLTNSTANSFLDITWRHFWFNCVLTTDVAIPWNIDGDTFMVANHPTCLLLPDNSLQMFFAGRRSSIKNVIVDELNSGRIDQSEAWVRFVLNIHNRAHSYREDIDSGLSHLGLLEDDGKPTELGYSFVDACERTGNCYVGKPKMILGAAILKNGDLAAFLHYFHKLSEARFSIDPLSFTQPDEPTLFNQQEYLLHIRTQLAENLQVMNTARIRGGQARSPFQGELAILRKFNLVEGFRTGVGLIINWPLVQEYMEYPISQNSYF